MKKTPKVLSPAQIAACERVLNRGDRVELVPAKDGVNVLHIQRERVLPEEKHELAK